MAAASVKVDLVPFQVIPTHFAVTLSMRKDKTSRPTIRIETALNDLPSSHDYPRGRVWQSAIWSEVIREVQHVSVTIELGSPNASRDRLAMNHTLAGLINYLDAASRVESLDIQLKSSRHFTTTELLQVIQPATILVRCRPDVAVKLIGMSEELVGAAVQARRSHSRDDDTVEQLYSKVRMVANAFGLFNLAGLSARLGDPNLDMSEIMAELEFVGPGSREKVEVAIGKVQGVLARLMEGIEVL
jgi:hypothetical protein